MEDALNETWTFLRKIFVNASFFCERLKMEAFKEKE